MTKIFIPFVYPVQAVLDNDRTSKKVFIMETLEVDVAEVSLADLPKVLDVTKTDEHRQAFAVHAQDDQYFYSDNAGPSVDEFRDIEAKVEDNVSRTWLLNDVPAILNPLLPVEYVPQVIHHERYDERVRHVEYSGREERLKEVMAVVQERFRVVDGKLAVGTPEPMWVVAVTPNYSSIGFADPRQGHFGRRGRLSNQNCWYFRMDHRAEAQAFAGAMAEDVRLLSAEVEVLGDDWSFNEVTGNAHTFAYPLTNGSYPAPLTRKAHFGGGLGEPNSGSRFRDAVECITHADDATNDDYLAAVEVIRRNPSKIRSRDYKVMVDVATTASDWIRDNVAPALAPSPAP